MNESEDIRGVVEARVRAMVEKDAEAAVSVLAPDVVAFEVAGPLQVSPAQATDVAATQAWLDGFDGSPRIEMRDLVIHAEGDVAFCHSLNRLCGRMRDGREIDLEMRSTLGFRRKAGAWSIVHAHTSVPR